MKTKKCKECGTRHSNKSKESNYKNVGDRCFNCQVFLDFFWLTIKALNEHIPVTGKPRRIEITGYKITKVK